MDAKEENNDVEADVVKDGSENSDIHIFEIPFSTYREFVIFR